MIKVVRFIKRNPAMTHEEFRSYWLEHHAPLQREIAAVSDVVKTVVSFTSQQYVTGGGATDLGSAGEPPFDAILELYFDEAGQLPADFTSDEGDSVAQRIIASEQRFTDPSAPLARIVTELVVIFERRAGQPAGET